MFSLFRKLKVFSNGLRTEKLCTCVFLESQSFVIEFGSRTLFLPGVSAKYVLPMDNSIGHSFKETARQKHIHNERHSDIMLRAHFLIIERTES